MPSQIRRVGVIGGGTAGFLTAIALRRKVPGLEVTVVESSKIPVIGVGEATTALFNYFLHHDLGIDVVDFFEKVQPTFKIGIRFEWGLPAPYYFNSPFQFGRLLEPLVYQDDINHGGLASRLMTENKLPVLALPDGGVRSLLAEIPFAYHVDNRRLVRFLHEHAAKNGVLLKDCVVKDVIATPAKDSIDHLLTEDGERLEFDLYIDCTGFRSMLLDRALGSSFLPYDSSLWNDTAVVADVPHGGLVRPYTVAETMDSGWCWNIPMEDCDHRGYVFSSRFCSVDQAADEMRRKNPGMKEPWTVRFRSGRHVDFWKGNTVAIGNAYGFVEPLQSTAIHMIIVEIQNLLRFFPQELGLKKFPALVNRRVGEVWDELRWFLAAHYKFNRRLDTPYWRASRADADITGIQDVVDIYRERAPIGATPQRFRELDDSTFGVFRHDLLFMGQQIPTSYVAPTIPRETWLDISAATERIVALALDHAPGVAKLRAQPELLYRYVNDIRRS